MNQLRVGICEDEKTQREYLARVVNTYYQQKNQSVEVETFTSAEELVFRYPESLPFSCMLLDIGLHKINGMELAERIRESDKKIPIVFITGDRDYALDGYKVGAVRYILKPYSESDLIEALECVGEIEKEQEESKDSYYCLNYQGEFVKIRMRDILYIEVQGHYISLYTKERRFYFKESMKNIRDDLPEEYFVPANRSVLLNIQHVEKISRKECVLCDGSNISVSRGCQEALHEKFVQYYRQPR